MLERFKPDYLTFSFRYFCEIFLDNAYCAKTSSKIQSEMLFWGEFFEFNNLKNINQIIIQLYREADKKKKKDKTTKIGCVSIPVHELGNKQLIEKWYTANSIVVGKQGRENRTELPLVRVRVKYQSVQILPLDLYHDFTEYIYPTKLTNNAGLQKNQENLKIHCQKAWKLNFNSKSYFHGELREVFAGFRENCLKSSKADLANNLISASIFLRFLCPAILSPSLFKLIQEYPSDKAVRTLTLIAKAIQKLANFTQFGGKEEFMVFLNGFVEDEMENMKHFLEDISTMNKDNAFLKNHADIDLGKELSILHSLLTDTLEKFNLTTVQKLHPLPEILGTLTAALKDPQVGKKQPNRKSQIYDNMAGTPGSSPPVSSLVQLCNKTVSQSKEVSSSVHLNRQTDDSWTSVSKEHISSELHDAFRKLSLGTDISDVSVTKQAENKKDSVNQSWSEILSTADVMNGQDNMISYIDDIQDGFLEIGSVDKNSHDFPQNNHTNNIGGVTLMSPPKTCLGQSSFMSSSDYQSVGYRQSNLPVDLSGGPTTHEQYSDMSLPSRLPSSGSLTPQHSSSIQQPLSFSNPLYKHQRNSQLTATASSSSSPLLGNGSPVAVPLASGAVAGPSPVAASAAAGVTPTLTANAMKMPQTSSSSSLSSTDDSNVALCFNVSAQMHQTRSPTRPMAASALGVGTTMETVHKISSPLQTLSQFPSSSSSSESSLCERRNYGRVGSTEMEVMQHGPALQRINPLYARYSSKPLTPDVYMRSQRQTGNGPSNLFSDMSPNTNLAFAGAQFEDSLRSLNSVGDANLIQCNTLPRRAERDRHLTASCVSDEFSMYTPGSRRSLAQTSTSMGLRGTPQQILEAEKTREETNIDDPDLGPEYEKEVLSLKQELMEVRSQLQEANCRSRFNPETGAQQMMQDWQQRLEESEERMRKQQAEKDDQMKTIIERSESEVHLVNKVAVAQAENK
ncbi:Ras/Rap GTPase-activating protein SynGAP,RAS protein activator like-3,Ras GTPase-activating protein gap-2,Probable Ras GTPase-activating protein,Disabled homolog 2-interacting protein,Ras GTPase-activating protein nGAP [Acanthosepion pharaonis]|uniref:Ras GTPase-activating protein n=1 Tax=Acanthosepion pharaonis TaxID=158019 RepID=A0A812CRU7_ACAPH|nr:Ras/Rap GTPase-activating protein SynGAP,RAS protein activator like-3,Ras GTPase-activating protein gap-2,Probable Ras GTPase-activating protein,Disabled homolog 2-interacting protein,Ras GTPase-activating protein nGAP [Sepia pharaonis]